MKQIKMFKCILIVLMFGFMCQAENVDVSPNSDSKTLIRIRRIPPEPSKKEDLSNVIIEEKKNSPKNSDITINTTKKNDFVNINSSSEKAAVQRTENVSVNQNDTDTHIFPVFPHARDHIGAAMRSFWVFLGLSVIILIYFTFRAFK